MGRLQVERPRKPSAAAPFTHRRSPAAPDDVSGCASRFVEPAPRRRPALATNRWGADGSGGETARRRPPSTRGTATPPPRRTSPRWRSSTRPSALSSPSPSAAARPSTSPTSPPRGSSRACSSSTTMASTGVCPWLFLQPFNGTLTYYNAEFAADCNF